MIEFHLDDRLGVPPYLQIVQQVKQALRLRRLVVGDQLPRVREVVASVAINPNTVLKAYRELEREGLTASYPGVGTFVVATLGGVAPANLARLRRGLTRWLEGAAQAGLDREGILALFTSALDDAQRGEEDTA